MAKQCRVCEQQTDALPLNDGSVRCEECWPRCNLCGCDVHPDYIELVPPIDTSIGVCGPCSDRLDAVGNWDAIEAAIAAYIDAYGIKIKHCNAPTDRALPGLKKTLEASGLLAPGGSAS